MAGTFVIYNEASGAIGLVTRREGANIMGTTRRWLGRAGLALVVLGLSTAGAMAQRPVRPLPPRPAAPAVTNFYPRTYYQQFPPYGVLQSPALPVNPNYYVAPGLTLNQYAYNLSVLGQSLSNFPPYAL